MKIPDGAICYVEGSKHCFFARVKPNTPSAVGFQLVGQAGSKRKMCANACQWSSLGLVWSCSHFRTVRAETPAICATSGWVRLASMRFNKR